MVIEVIIAVAVLSAGFVVGVSLFGYWYWNFREWLDQKLMSALKGKMLSELTDKGAIVAGPRNTLFSWLYIAWWCAHKTEPTYNELFSYQLANNKTLAAFLVEESNHPENSVPTQQMCVQNLVLLWHTQKLKADEHVSTKKLTRFQRFVKWLFTDSTPASGMVFDTRGFTQQTALEPLQETMSKVDKNLIYKNEPSSLSSELAGNKLPEKYTPQEQLKPNPLSALLHKPLDVNFSIQEIPQDSLIGKQEPLTTVIELDLNQAMEHGQEQVVARSQTIDRKMELHQALEQQITPLVTSDMAHEHEVKRDRSICHALTADKESNIDQDGYSETRSWLMHMRTVLSSKSDYKTTVYLSEAAEAAVKQLGDSFHRRGGLFDLEEELPLGFFVDEETVKAGNTFEVNCYIRFDKALYDRQKQDPQLTKLKLDPFASQGLYFRNPHYTNTYKRHDNLKQKISTVTSEHVFSELKARHIELSATQKTFLTELHNKKWCRYTEDKKPTQAIFHVLIKIIKEPTSTSEHILAFLNVLIALETKLYGCNGSDDPPLKCFADNYFYKINVGTYFHSPEAMQYLELLASSNDSVLFKLFYKLSEHTTDTFNCPNFLQIARRVFYVYDYLKVRNIPIKNSMNDQFDMLSSHPYSVISYLTDVENKHPVLFEWVGAHLNTLPGPSLTRAKKALKAGYSFIHRAMCFNDDNVDAYYGEERFLHSLPAQEQKNILRVSTHTLKSFQDCDAIQWKGSQFEDQSRWWNSASHSKIDTTCLHKRAIFLRYLAYQVEDSHVVDAIKKWEETIGPLEDHQPKFDDNAWQEMVLMALRLPKRVEQPIIKENITMRSFNSFIYTTEDIDRLLAHLSTQDSTLDIKETNKVIQKLNAMVKPYGKMPGALLEAQALFRRISSVDKEKNPDKYQAVLNKFCEIFDSLNPDHKLLIHKDLPQELASIIQTMQENDFDRGKNDIATWIENYLETIKLKKIHRKQKLNQLAEDIALIRELYHRMTYASSHKIPKEGKWLRLEQVVAIILGYTKKISQQIETSEGKTLIIGCTALLHALSGKQPDVLTHNSLAAESGANELSELAYYFGVDVAFQSKPSQTVGNAIDILYVDIGTAILAHLCDKIQNKDSHMQSDGIALTTSSHKKKRQADVAVIDEVDNIAIDIQADTTMQISEGASKKLDNHSLHQLNVFKNWIEQDTHAQLLTQPFSQENTREAFSNFSSDTKIDQNYWTKQTFYFWLKAARLAKNLKPNEDYVIHKATDDPTSRAVYLVHKTTTGRVDKISKWGEGVHTYVSLCERVKQGDPSIIVPGVSQVIEKNNVIDYLSTYPSHSSYSGTFGKKATTKKIKEIVRSDHVIKFPRAKRQETETFAWPLVPKKKQVTQPKYSRAYHFPPIICENTQAQFERILQAVKNLQDQGKSCLILWNTIMECENFSAYLMNNGIEAGHIQVFDDARDTQAEEEDPIRPTPDVIINRAKEPRMITIGTAIAGRGIDFKEISGVIITKTGLGRVIQQKKGRGGRDFDFASIHEIYAQLDFPEFNETFEVLRKSTENPEQEKISEKIETTKVQGIHVFFKNIVKKHEQKLEKNILAKLNHQRREI